MKEARHKKFYIESNSGKLKKQGTLYLILETPIIAIGQNISEMEIWRIKYLKNSNNTRYPNLCGNVIDKFIVKLLSFTGMI